MAQASPESVLSHWSKLLEGMQASPLEFYASVEEAVKSRQIPGAEISRVDWHEEGPLEKAISNLASGIRVMERAIFNVHCPPYGIGLDLAPEVDGDLRVVSYGGEPKLVPVGSTVGGLIVVCFAFWTYVWALARFLYRSAVNSYPSIPESLGR